MTNDKIEYRLKLLLVCRIAGILFCGYIIKSSMRSNAPMPTEHGTNDVAATTDQGALDKAEFDGYSRGWEKGYRSGFSNGFTMGIIVTRTGMDPDAYMRGLANMWATNDSNQTNH